MSIVLFTIIIIIIIKFFDMIITELLRGKEALVRFYIDVKL